MSQFLNRERMVREMERQKIDVLVASSLENTSYVSDSPIPGFVVFPRDQKLSPFIVTWVAYADKVVDSKTWIHDVKYCGTFFFEHFEGSELIDLEKGMYAQVGPVRKEVEDWWKLQRGGVGGVPGLLEKLVEGLKERGLDKGTIGIEEKGMTISMYESLKGKLGKATLKIADEVFNYARMVKTPFEIALFREGTPIVEEGITAVCKIAREGISEQELFNEYKRTVVSRGAGIPSNTIFAVGHRSVMPTSGVGLDRSVKLRRGDMIRFNPIIEYKNHPFHMGRTAVLGEPRDAKLKIYYTAMLAGENAEIEAIRPGVKASEVYALCDQAVKQSGIPHYRRHQVGHALGIGSGYDKPIFAFNDDTVLEEGMIFNLEPNYFEFGLGGLQLEDTLVVTKNGCELLTTTKRDLWVI
jgi:Xaa-Pro dipeptidase